MTEDEAIDWARARVTTTTFERIATFGRLVVEENARQNLISPATVDALWSRHIVDSLQLLDYAEDRAGPWLDIGTGGGFPGMVIAIARDAPAFLVEPRRKRAEFLAQSAGTLGLHNIDVRQAMVEKVKLSAEIISARAVATIDNILLAAQHCATTTTRWLLPRGSVDRDELAATARRHRLTFHVEQSLTHSESSIVILEAQ